MGLLSDKERKEFEQDWAELSRNPNAVFCTPIVMDIIARKT